MKKKSFNCTRLSEVVAGAQSTDKIDLVVELDFLGTLNIEGKYLQASIIPWLIAQVKLLEIEKRIISCCIEISVIKNSIIGYESFRSKAQGLNRNEFLNHRLSSIFKLCTLINDENYFAYFYKQKGSTVYTLHVFYTNKSNLAKFLSDLQVQAIRLHESQNSYEKLYDFELSKKFTNISKEQFEDPVFLQTLLTTHIKTSKYQQEYHIKKGLHLKLTPNRLYLDETNEETVEKEYKNILYFNRPIRDESHFCLAFSQQNNSRKITIIILYSDDADEINDAINCYNVYVSSELAVKITDNLKVHNHICTLCPMQQFCELCEYLNTFISQPEKIYKILVKILETNLELLDQNYLFDCLSERNLCLNPPLLSNFEPNVFMVQTNQLIVSLIHKLCKMKQNQHMILNIRNKTENDLNNIEISEKLNARPFLLMKSFNKTKSFNPIINNIPEITHRRRNTIESSTFVSTQSKLTFIDLFLEKNPFQLKKINSNNCNKIIPKNKDTIRSVIFYKIVGTPNSSSLQSSGSESSRYNFKRFKTSLDIRQFWKKVISEQILLNKMESENKTQRAKLIKKNNKNVDNSYLEITPCLKNIEAQWIIWLSNDQQLCSFNEVHNALFKGVPQVKRGKVWLWLINQHKLAKGGKTLKREFLFTDLSYKELLRQSTIHQHSILLDLGRTFPTHPNFSKKLGTGQLALFNVLKAYSIMDPEVGYCQGLSFIVGILLIHVDNSEEEAFEMLKFLLVDLNIREQYKPNMHALQKYMYQFSRLIYEKSPEIYTHLDSLEISSSLYAASWFLTFFSSTFQIGFVARVFDFLFHQGFEVLFNISLTILMIHKPILLMNNEFESVVEHLKNIIPEMSLIESELIINRSFDFGLKPLLDKYDTEFNVISEEMEHFPVISNETNEKKQDETYISSLEAENITLKDQLKGQLDAFKINQLKMENQEDTLLKLDHENRQLKCRVKTFEIERQVLLEKIKNQENLINSNYCE